MDLRTAKAPPKLLSEIPTNRWTEPFWAAARQHELRLAQCGDCDKFRMPPTPFCPHCRSQKVNWIAIVTRGVLYSYTIVERTVLPGIAMDLPYVPAIVEFPELDHVRLITNIVGSRICDIAVGRAVQLHWHLPQGAQPMPVFAICI